jgi:Tol biopolymer transport system component
MLVVFVTAIVFSGGSAKSDFTFGEPVNLGPTVNDSSSEDYFPCPSADGLEIFFVSGRPGGEGAEDLWVTTRSSVAEPWADPINLGPTVNTSSTETGPTLSADGLELYFSAYCADGFDILMTTRPTRNSPWGEPVNLGSFFYVDSETLVVCPSLSGDGLELYVAMGHAEPVHEWSVGVARRDSRDAPWQAPVRLGPQINSWSCQGHPGISSDGLLLVFSDIWACSPRPGGLGGTDIWLARRATRDGEWGTAINLGAPVNAAFGEDFAKISPDGSTLYFTTYHHTATGEIDWATGDLYQAPIIPTVDLNGDGIVDSADMCIIVDHWGTDNSLCDIGPMPWGDGIVDVQDLIVLAKHLFEESPPAEPIE